MSPSSSNPEKPLVSLANAGLRRGGRWLVRGVEFSVRRGEIVTLIGPNGSGKSTSARMAIGVLEPSEGKVARHPGLKVGYVPQKLSVDWTMPLTVRRLMTLTGTLSQADIDEALEAVGIPHLHNAEVQHLSGGNSSGRSWRGRSRESRISWCWTNRSRASISVGRSRSTI